MRAYVRACVRAFACVHSHACMRLYGVCCESPAALVRAHERVHMSPCTHSYARIRGATGYIRAYVRVRARARASARVRGCEGWVRVFLLDGRDGEITQEFLRNLPAKADRIALDHQIVPNRQIANIERQIRHIDVLIKCVWTCVWTCA